MYLNSFKPANNALALSFLATRPIDTIAMNAAASKAPQPLPINLTPEEIRAMVRDILG